MKKTHKKRPWGVLLTATGAILAATAFTITLILSGNVNQGLEQLEREIVAARVKSALQAFDDSLQNLSELAAAYSRWDDTYRFLDDRNQEYIESNYIPRVLSKTPVDLVAIYDYDGKLIFGQAIDDAGRAIPLPKEVEKLSVLGQSLPVANDEEAAADVLWMGGRGYFVICRRISNSDGTAPPRGLFLFGRLIDEPALSRIKQLTGVDVVFEPNKHELPNPRIENFPFLGKVQIQDAPSPESPTMRSAHVGRDLGSQPIWLALHLPSHAFETSRKLTETLRTGFLLLSFGFTIFLILAGAELMLRVREGEKLRLAKEKAENLARLATAADGAKSVFLATMSHEIRTPLHAIIGYAELLEDMDLSTDTAKNSIKIIRESSGLLMEILNGILDLSKIEAGKLSLQKGSVEIRSLVSSVVHTFRTRAEEKGNSITAKVAGDVPEYVEADAVRVKQVLLNLVSNAVKYTDGGTISISVRPEAIQGQSEQFNLIIEVADEGIGISEKDEKLLFESFSQIHSPSQSQHNGTGIGLAICRRLCGLMEGKIAFERRADRGSIFRFSFPTHLAEPIESVRPAPLKPRRLNTNLSILVVDDNKVNALLIQLILRRFGIEAQFALSGEHAIALCNANDFDLIFMDIQMPGMGGLEAAGKIRTLESAASKPPAFIVALTADILTTDSSISLAAGMNAYLSKPLQISAVKELLLQISGDEDAH